MSAKLRLLPLLVLSFAVTAAGAGNEPHIGYIYPAGGQRGTTVKIVAGGQFLRGARDVYVTGPGVTGKVVKFYRPIGNLNREQAQLLRSSINDVRDRRLMEAGITPPPRRTPPAPENRPPADSNQADESKKEEVKMPEHPLLEDLENKSLRELAHITTVLFTDRRKQQPNRQLGELVLIEVAIDPNAEPGDRELRLLAAGGLTNPMVFKIGGVTEIRELEPNDEGTEAALPGAARLPDAAPIELPAALNGQIMPGDIDRFTFRARRGQQLVITVDARSLIPYLADAVPGWFQAAVTLYDAKGEEVAFSDDYRFNPDPVLCYSVTADGEYTLEIRDAIYRGREDFVFRVTIDERPFVTQIFPLGGHEGTHVAASIQGWNLRGNNLTLDTSPGERRIRQAAYDDGRQKSSPVTYAVDRLPEFTEAESNDTSQHAQDVNLPVIINGRIGKAGDVDVFRFAGRAGEDVVAEVSARQLNSPLDSLVRLMDEDGNVLAWNDDYVVTGQEFLYKNISGLLTHHADSYLTFRLPKDGHYLLQIADSQQHGGSAWGYRLRISHPMPDFALRMTPSSLSFPVTGTAAFCVHVLRKDGYKGEIRVRPCDPVAGFRIGGDLIPAGCDRICMTVTAPRAISAEPVELQLEGVAGIGGREVVHPVVPAEDMMQAFLYRHLVPSQKLVLAFTGPGRRIPPVDLAGPAPVHIVPGSTATVRFRAPGRRPVLSNIELELYEAPAGLALEDVNSAPDGVTFRLKADKDILAGGYIGNIIVEAFRRVVPRAQRGGAAPAENRRVSIGFLPAIPVEVVGPSTSLAACE